MIEFSKELEKYILDHTEPENEMLQSLWRETNVNVYHPRQCSGHVKGKMLEMLCRMIKPANVLEIGTFTGYSAISIAQALSENGIIHTIEINDELEDFINSYIEKSGLRDKIILHIGDALKIIPQLSETFDFVFIDGEKNQYPEYYNCVFDKVSSGGFIIADNVLWSGKVHEKNFKNNDHFTKGIQAFNDYIHNDSRIQNLLLPVFDGLMLLRKK